MSLKKRMRIISVGYKVSAGYLSKLKKEAERLTKEHEAAVDEAYNKHGHEYAIKRGHKPNGSEREVQEYEQAKNHYVQHELSNEHPELHKKLERLSLAAPQARVAYKHAFRNR